MKAIFSTSILLVLLNALSFAGPGDTVRVAAKDTIRWDSLGAFFTTADFPDIDQKQYRKIWLKATLGCQSSGCGQWNYTTKFAIIDSSGSQPEPIEIGRAATPYAAGKNSDWEHPWYFDVTDYQMLMDEETQLRTFYRGPRDGFTISLEFIMIEGTPPRNPISVENIYKSSPMGFYYGFDTTDINNNKLVPRKLAIPQNAEEGKVRVGINGHGFGDANGNCSEFCQKYYKLLLDGQEVGHQEVWRDDCDMSPFPQAGSWILSRSNWCPGTKTTPYQHAIYNLASMGDSLTLEMNMESHQFIEPSGGNFTPPRWVIDAQFITYGEKNFTNDVAVERIIAPSENPNHARYNPVCDNPVIEIKNIGSATLTSATIVYGDPNGPTQTHEWTGNLDFLESDTVQLPPFANQNEQLTGGTFEVTVNNPNGNTDENNLNNTMRSYYEKVPEYPREFIFRLETNEKPPSAGSNYSQETGWTLTNGENEVVMERRPESLDFNTAYEDTFDLKGGCYTLTIHERKDQQPYGVGDGLNYFCCGGSTLCNQEGCGKAELVGVASLPEKDLPRFFEGNFGRQIQHQFLVDCRPPKPDFEFTQNEKQVIFNNQSPRNQDWEWRFGNGTTDSGKNPTHTYSDTGEYEVTLMATNNCGNTQSITKTVDIDCPQVTADFDAEIDGLTVNLNNNSENSREWTWYFGDGTTDTAFAPVHTFSDSGTYKICLKAMNFCDSDSVCQTFNFTSTGAIQKNQALFTVYPNPASSTLIIEYPEVHSAFRYQLFDATGRKVKQGQSTAKANSRSIDVRSLPEGVYWIKGQTGSRQTVEQVVIQK